MPPINRRASKVKTSKESKHFKSRSCYWFLQFLRLLSFSIYGCLLPSFLRYSHPYSLVACTPAFLLCHLLAFCLLTFFLFSKHSRNLHPCCWPPWMLPYLLFNCYRALAYLLCCFLRCKRPYRLLASFLAYILGCFLFFSLPYFLVCSVPSVLVISLLPFLLS